MNKYKITLHIEDEVYAESEEDAKAVFWDDYHISGGDLFEELHAERIKTHV